MNDLTNPMSLTEKLESFLTRACEAEEAENCREAERLFRMALYCEGTLRTDVTNTRDYVSQVGPVYKDAQQLAQ